MGMGAFHPDFESDYHLMHIGEDLHAPLATARGQMAGRELVRYAEKGRQ